METELRRGRRVVRLTRLERVWWPEAGLRKGDVVEYYRALAPVVVPHVRGRPFAIKRHYTVPRGPFAWEKDAPHEMPAWIPTCPLPAKSRSGALVNYPLVNDELALLWMVEYGCVDLHVWTSRCRHPERPDHVLFDLDPAGVRFPAVVRAALVLKDALDSLDLVSFVMTTGGEGLHVRVPVARGHTFADARSFCDVVAGALARRAAALAGPRAPFGSWLGPRGGRAVPPGDERREEEHERERDVRGPGEYLEKRRISVVAEEGSQELSYGRVLAHDPVRVPDVFDRHGKKPGLLELVHPVGEEPGGEDDEQRPRHREELTQVQAA